MKAHILRSITFATAACLLMLGVLHPTVETQINNPVGQWTVVTSTSTGTLNDFTPGLSGNTVVRMNNATLATITGLAGGFAGERVIIQSVGAGQVDLMPSGVSTSAAANQFINYATVGNTSEAAGVGEAEYVYDATSTKWRLLQHEQGAWITPTYDGTKFTSSGGTWTVDSGDISEFKYKLTGRSLSIRWNISQTTVGAGTTTNLNIANAQFGGYTTSATAQYGSHDYSDNTGTHAIGRCFMLSSVIILQKVDISNWSVATNATLTFGAMIVEVQ